MRTLLISILILLFTGLITNSGHAQCARWKKDFQHWQIRSGIGLLPSFAKDRVTTITPPLSLELRYQFNPTFSLGLLAGRSISAVTRTDLNRNKETYQNDFRMLALRASAHTHRWTKWQAYGGVVIGYQDNNIDYQRSGKEIQTRDSSPQYRPTSQLLYSAFIGSAYHPIPRLEIFGELGFGLSILSVGFGYSW
jgi:hypothetical protein